MAHLYYGLMALTFTVRQFRGWMVQCLFGVKVTLSAMKLKMKMYSL